MSKDSKNTNPLTFSRLKIAAIILILIITTYAFMAVVTHISLNLESADYSFLQSINFQYTNGHL
jgi:hypothetical protein